MHDIKYVYLPVFASLLDGGEGGRAKVAEAKRKEENDTRFSILSTRRRSEFSHKQRMNLK